MELTRATAADLPGIVSLMNRAYRGRDGWAVEEGYIRGDRICLPDLEAEIAAKPDLQWLVWREAGVLLGTVSLEPMGDDVWYLGSLTVEPAQQASQAGRRLLAAAEAIVLDAGGRRIELTVIWVREALIGWYERRGYMPAGKTTPFPYGDERWGVPTRDDLYFVWLEKVF